MAAKKVVERLVFKGLPRRFAEPDDLRKWALERLKFRRRRGWLEGSYKRFPESRYGRHQLIVYISKRSRWDRIAVGAFDNLEVPGICLRPHPWFRRDGDAVKILPQL